MMNTVICNMQRGKKWIVNINLKRYLLKDMIKVCDQTMKKNQLMKKNQRTKKNRLIKNNL